MRLVTKISLNLLKWIFILLILLFSVATFMGQSYLQTGLLWLLLVGLAWWPAYITKTWSKGLSVALRMAFIMILLVINLSAFKPEPKSSIYLSEQSAEELTEIYDKKAAVWPQGTEDIYIDTEYGKVHLLAYGSEDKPPMVMIHAASMGAHSWFENLEPLEDHYRIYSIDNIGEGNKSELNDPMEFPADETEIAEHLAYILTSLGIERAPIFGASNGGFVALCFADRYPERVESLALFGPMGLTQLSGKSMMMLSIPTMYPFQFIRDRVSLWAIGEDPYVNEKYGDWFDCMMKGTIPSVAAPVPMTMEQKSGMDFPVLLFLGTHDQIVSDAEEAKKAAETFPNIRIEILESGHLVAVEKRDEVNRAVKEFLAIL